MASYPLYDELTPKQQAFVDAYLTNPNATEAARKAGYSAPRSQGSRMLTNVDIQAALQERGKPQAAAKQHNIMAADEVLGLLTEFARDPGVEPKDRIKAAELLGRRFALWQESHEVTETERGFLILPVRKK
jgi:phage terminase small subunit